VSIALIAGLVVVALIVAIALSQRAGGPRVTTIERKTEERDEDRDA
jgi:hypothetical protein